MSDLTRTVGAAAAVALLLVSAGCSSADTDGRDKAADPASHDDAFGHVHDLGVNPADGRLYVASHMGVFRQSDDGFERIADRWQDTMAFTVAGPDHFLASGHPDMREDKPTHLGLIESTDAAESWTALSLEGEADFHALELAGDRLYGFDALTGTLMVTEDRRTWEDLLSLPVLDVAADPEDPEALVIVDQRGELMRWRTGGAPAALEAAPRIAFLDWSEPGRIVGLGGEADVWVSEDGGETWREAGVVPGGPQALTTDGDNWYAATDQGLFTSTDRGESWESVPLG
ncbi:MAG TPA: hypothetical protein VK964_02620 [Nocardioidaceae bacterium]|nr:hypothetical protein [Nocardioidaceae bacterium]